MGVRNWLSAFHALSPSALQIGRDVAGGIRADDGIASRSVAGHVERVSYLTGSRSPARTDKRWNVSGTDLGFSFKYQDMILAVFGDTWGRGGIEADDWRSNVMAVISPDSAHGYVIEDMLTDESGEAKELISSRKRPGDEYTVIPTAGLAVGDRMFLHYMSIRDWMETGRGTKQPSINGAGIAFSDDRGETWAKSEEVWWSGNGHFTQCALVQDGEDVYLFGAPAGRLGPARLLRAKGGHLASSAAYEYWTGTGWGKDSDDAAVVIPSPVGELSVRWCDHLQCWVAMYLNDVVHAIVLRTAQRLVGPWSEERIVATALEYPTLYAPFMFPDIEGPDIYFAMSIFKGEYNVSVMRLQLDEVA